MSKPTKNRVMCPECFKQKMLFETQKQADNFIKWNGDDIDTHGGELRSYYCQSCGGWHITSKPYKKVYEYNTQNLIKRYEKDKMLSNSKTINIEGVSDYTQEILKRIPREINSKTKLKAYLTAYFADNSIKDNTTQQNIRKEIYGLMKNGKYAIRTRTICNKVLSDEEIVVFIKDYKIENSREFNHAINKAITKHNIIISRQQRQRIFENWYKERFEKEKKENNDNKKEEGRDYVNDVYLALIKEVPSIDEPQPKFIRSLVDSFVKVNKDLPHLSSKERNNLKRIAMEYYFKKE